MKPLLLIVVVCFIAFTGSGQIRTSWPMLSGDSYHTSYAEMELSFPLVRTRTIYAGYNNENGLAVADGKVFVSDYSDVNRIHCADEATGDTLWSFGLPGTGGGVNFLPAVFDTVVLMGGQGGEGLYARNTENGDSLWLLPVGSLYSRCPMISDSLVYLPAPDSFCCVDLYTGEKVWTHHLFSGAVSPVVDASAVYYSSQGEIAAFNKWTGDTLWINDSIPAGGYRSYALDDTYLYTVYLRKAAAIDKTTGAVVWTYTLDESEEALDFPNAMALKGDALLIKHLDTADALNHYIILDKSTGSELVRYAGGAMTYQTPTIVNNYVVEFNNGILLFLDLMTGEVIYQIDDIPIYSYGYQVVAANNKIYVAASGPNVYVYESAATATKEGEQEIPLVLSPNPAMDRITVTYELESASAIRYRILTTTGQLISSQNEGVVPAGKHSCSIPLNGLPNGLYYYELLGETIHAIRPFTVTSAR